MDDAICPDRERLVQELAEAINHRKRLEGDDTHSPKDRMKADETVNRALEAVRAHKLGHRCDTGAQPGASASQSK